MRTTEAEGTTVDEAITSALSSLGVDRGAVEIEVLEEPGHGVGDVSCLRARVRATLRARSDDGASSGQSIGGVGNVSRETAIDPAERAARALEVLKRIVESVVDGAQVAIEDGDEDGSMRLVIHADDGGAIIGRHGQTLDAIEHLVNRVVFRDEAPSAGRLSVDIEGYRERRRESLTQQALRLAAKARETGRSIPMSPMSARDRRTVHLALRDEPGVTTESEGERDLRRVVVIPERTGSPGPHVGRL